MPRQRAPGALTLLLAVLLLALPACTPRGLLLSSGAALGTAGLQERGVRGATSDYNLRLLINDAWFKASLALYQRVSLLISNGRIVLIGRVPDDAMRERAESLAQEATHRSVINRITTGPDLPMMTSLRDKGISARLEADMTFDRDVAAINYAVETQDGVVYVIGEARSEAEARRVRYLAEHGAGVRAAETFIRVPPLLAVVGRSATGDGE